MQFFGRNVVIWIEWRRNLFLRLLDVFGMPLIENVSASHRSQRDCRKQEKLNFPLRFGSNLHRHKLTRLRNFPHELNVLTSEERRISRQICIDPRRSQGKKRQTSSAAGLRTKLSCG